MKYQEKTKEIKTYDIELNQDDIFDLIQLTETNSCINIENLHSIDVYIDIPHGGDYSGQKLVINDDVPIKIRITTKEKKMNVRCDSCRSQGSGLGKDSNT